MSSETITVRYNGPVLAGHRMDVSDLAPALLGISELCKIANAKFNGGRSAVKVLIGTDIEHKCFQVNLDVVQTIWEHAKSILHNDNTRTAKEILEWLGLLAPPAAGVAGFFQVLKGLQGQKISSATTIEDKTERGLVRIVINGDHSNVVITRPETLALVRDQGAVDNAKKVVQPLLKDGYESLEFEFHGDVVERIESDEAELVWKLDSSDLEQGLKDEPQLMTAWITVYSPVYDAKAPKWRFKFGGAREYVDISETDIAAQAIKRGGSMIDDAYRVQLELTQEHTPNGTITNHYKVKKVLDFKPARLPYQHDAFRDLSDDDADTGADTE